MLGRSALSLLAALVLIASCSASDSRAAGRIVARCLHDMPIPVGDEMASYPVIEICALTPEGEVLGRLPDRASAIEPDGLAISPDGSRLAYRVQSGATEDDTVVVVDLITGSTSARWNLTTSGYSGDVTWASDGSSLLFVDDRDVVVQPIDGSSAMRYRATDESVEFGLGPALMSPDGNWIAVRAGSAVALIDTETGERRTLEDLELWAYSWSQMNELSGVAQVPDPASQDSWDTTLGEVVVVDPVSATAKVLVVIDDATAQPAWSPSGEELFVADVDTGWFLDPRAEADDSVNRQFISDTPVFNPSWSPDGSAIVAQTSGRPGGASSELVIIDAATGEVDVVEHDPLAAGSIGVAQASWVDGDWTWDGLPTTWPAQDPPREPDE